MMSAARDAIPGATSAMATNLLDLSDDLAARILLRLKPHEISATALTCKRLASVCADDSRVWQPLCSVVWSSYTNPDHWLHISPISTSSERILQGQSWASKSIASDNKDDDGKAQPPTSYRSVFATLRRLQPLLGLWKGAGDGPRGSLFRICWAQRGEGHLQVVALRASGRRLSEGGVGGAAANQPSDAPTAAVVEEVTARVGTSYPGVELRLVDESFALLEMPWKRYVGTATAASPAGSDSAGSLAGSGGGAAVAAGGGGGGAGRPSAAALAAAAVATGGCGSDALLGASPPRSFGYEVLKFMEAHVAGSRAGSRKNRNRGDGAVSGSPGPNGGGSMARPPVVSKHLLRLHVPHASRPRPLAGLWTGVYGPHGLEIISLSYDGRGDGSRLVATKLTGDPNVPAGEVTFRADLEPLPQPWPISEVGLITERAMFTVDPDAALAAAMAADAAAEMLPQRPGVPVWMAMALEPDSEELRLEELAAAAAAADPVDPWDYLAPTGQRQIVSRPSQRPPAPPLQEQQHRGPRRSPSRVVAVYRAEARIAEVNFQHPRWVDARVWVYDNGSIGVLWRGNLNFLVDFDRLDAQLLSRTDGPPTPGAAADVGPRAVPQATLKSRSKRPDENGTSRAQQTSTG